MTTFFDAILNGWWQGILLTFMVWIVLRDLPRISAATRLAIWQLTLVIVLLLPVIQGLLLPIWNEQSKRLTTPAAPALSATSTASDLVPESKPLPPSPARPLVELTKPDIAPFLVVIAGLLALFQVLRLMVGYWVVRRLKKTAHTSEVLLPQPSLRKTRVMVSERIGMPIAIGYLNPVILLPSDLVTKLKESEMEHVLLHESAHLERKDDWVALAERLVRALFAFQPAVHFIGRQIEKEREMACDDWVVAKMGQSKPYAAALTRVAELGSSTRIPILATGAGRRKEIFARLEALLDGTRNKMPSISEPFVMLAGLLLILAVTQAAPFSFLFGFSRYNNRSVSSDGDTRREFRTRGEILYKASDEDVDSMSPGALLVLEHSDHWNSRSVEIEADLNGKMERRFFVGGIRQSFGAEANRFLARELQQWTRETGVNLRERTARWVEKDGIEGALREIRSIQNGNVKRRYLEELLTNNKLNAEQLRRSLRVAGEMHSDSDKQQFLEATSTRFIGAGLDSALLDFIDTVQSDGDRKKLLSDEIHLIPEAYQSRVLRSVGLLHSDGDKKELLIQAAERMRNPLPAAFFEATSTINSDGDRKEILLAVLENHGKELDAVLRVTRAMSSIHSDGDRTKCLSALLEAPGGNTDSLREILLEAGRINSDGDKAEVLVLATRTTVEQEPARTAFFDATQSIHSSGDQRRVLLALLDRPGLPQESVLAASRLALQMHSREDQEAVLNKISRR